MCSMKSFAPQSDSRFSLQAGMGPAAAGSWLLPAGPQDQSDLGERGPTQTSFLFTANPNGESGI